MTSHGKHHHVINNDLLSQFQESYGDMRNQNGGGGGVGGCEEKLVMKMRKEIEQLVEFNKEKREKVSSRGG